MKDHYPEPFVPLRCSVFVLASVAFMGGCASEGTSEANVMVIDSLPSPAGLRSGEANLAAASDGRVYLTWIERTGETGHALRVSALSGESWSAPRTVTERNDLFVNWADFPSLVELPSGRLVTYWLQKTGGRGVYDIHVVQSTDAGETWSPSVVPHRDGLSAEHGFVSMFDTDGDSTVAVWLDGRRYAQADSTRRQTQLTTTRIAANGTLGSEDILDDRICDCCQTSAARASGGPVVVYRDRSATEVRDIYIVRHTAGAWSAPAPVHNDGWEIAACPVNGPAVVAHGDTLAVAWFTGARDTARVKVAFSTDGGVTFGAPIQVDDGNPAGRVDVELDESGRALVVWIERVGGENAEVRVRTIDRAGTRGPALPVATSSAARASGFPRMVRRGSDFILAWTEPGDSARVRVARARTSVTSQ